MADQSFDAIIIGGGNKGLVTTPDNDCIKRLIGHLYPSSLGFLYGTNLKIVGLSRILPVFYAQEQEL